MKISTILKAIKAKTTMCKYAGENAHGVSDGDVGLNGDVHGTGVGTGPQRGAEPEFAGSSAGI